MHSGEDIYAQLVPDMQQVNKDPVLADQVTLDSPEVQAPHRDSFVRRCDSEPTIAGHGHRHIGPARDSDIVAVGPEMGLAKIAASAATVR